MPYTPTAEPAEEPAPDVPIFQELDPPTLEPPTAAPANPPPVPEE